MATKTKTSTRVAIIVIAVLMLFSTIGLYIMVVINSQQQRDDSNKQQALSTELQTLLAERQKKVDAQAKELSAKYYDIFKPFKDHPKAFNAENVKELKTEDLVVGDGAEITKDTKYSAYYIGWQPDGSVFDSSFSDGSLKTPIASGSLIAGWTEGVIGMKFGGVRQLTIPASKAYGITGSGTKGQAGYIPPNTPLKFIVLVIPQVEDIPYTDRTLELYKQLYGSQTTS
ncbi:FKBP-type peptidyl-prolyl cis-trans isomerase [Candidatus Saccharibacteria bacterium]|nr:FKBP-type peptidyl-prolyl cis-trans isomerase [Candidatus Saccharibacteria bacterium]